MSKSEEKVYEINSSTKVDSQKILEVKHTYVEQKQKIEEKKNKKRNQVISVLKEYVDDISKIPSHSAIVDKVISMTNQRLKHAKDKKQRMMEILKKILQEYKRKQEIYDAAHKRTDYKVKRKERIIEDMEIVGTKIVLQARPELLKELEIIEEPADELIVDTEAKPEKKKDKKGKKGKKDKKDKQSKKEKGKSSTKSKASKAVKNKKNKKEKKSKLEIIDLILPNVPIVNKRRIITADEIYKLHDLINDFDMLDNILQEREDYEIEKLADENMCFKEDSSFHCNPSEVIFKDYTNKNIYKKKLTFKNCASVHKKCRFDKVIWNEDVEDSYLIQIEPIGIQKLYPGLGISFQVVFSPENIECAMNGRIIFITYIPNTNDYKQITLDLFCYPACPRITIHPNIVTFTETPIWKAEKRKQLSKSIKISNSGTKNCKIVIQKVHDPVEIESNWKKIICMLELFQENRSVDPLPINIDMTNQLDSSFGDELKVSRTLIEECVENVFNYFSFSKYFFNLPGKTEETITIKFKNIDHLGFHLERYCVYVYEKFPDGKSYCIGIQDILVNAETTGMFLSTLPEMLDFEVCVFNSVYQLYFYVKNPNRISHHIKIQFPKELRDYLSCLNADIILQPYEENHCVFIKFAPRRDIILEKNKYYDPETTILEFFLNIHIRTKTFEDSPPLKIPIFAALTEPLGLLIRPIDMEYSSVYNGEYLIDMGVCTNTETVYTDIEVSNMSSVPQLFGFLNLPQCITMFPNYGFGHIYPYEKKVFSLMFSPDTEDLIKFASEDESNTVILKISVDTIKNKGALKKILEQKKILVAFRRMEKRLQKLRTEDTTLTTIMAYLVKVLSTQVSLFTLRSSTDSASLFIIDASNKIPKDVTELQQYINADVEEKEKLIEITQYNSTIGDDFKTTNDNTIRNEEFTQCTTTTLGDSEYSNVPSPDIKADALAITPNNDTYKTLTYSDLQSNVIWIKAYTNEALCDISHQYIRFPDTPCGSYSVMNVELKACKYNDITTTKPHKHKISKTYSAHFEIIGNNDQISIEPICGDIKMKQHIKLTLIAKPQTPQSVIEEKAKALKMLDLIGKKRAEMELKKQKEKDLALMKAKKAKAKKGGANKKGKKADKASSKSSKDKKGKKEIPAKEDVDIIERKETEIIIDPSEVVIGYFDFYPAEMCVWRNMEPYFIDADFTCTITYTSKHFTREPETFYLKARCCVIRPDFIHNFNIQELDYGPVSIGTSEGKVLDLQNIQYKSIHPRISFVSPIGGFSCKNTNNTEVPSEHTLKIPLNFYPRNEGQEFELFDIITEKTIYPFILRGEGVHPNISFNPDFLVCRLESKQNGNVDCSIEIINDSHAPVTVVLRKICDLEGEIKPEELIKNKEKVPGKKTNAKSKKSPRDKSSKEKKKPKFSEILMEDEIYSIKNFFRAREEVTPLFEVFGNAANNSLNLPANSRGVVKVRFGIPTPPKQPKGKMDKKTSKKEKGKGSDKKSSKGSGKGSGKDNKTKLQQFYLAKYNVMMGNLVFLKDIIVIGTFKL